jgi:hypothetical protein
MDHNLLRESYFPFKAQAKLSRQKKREPLLLFIMLLLLWTFAPLGLHHLDESAGSVDQSIWLLILLGMICFLLISALCWWLLQIFWAALGLPNLKWMVLQFNSLELCQQLSFYWASFALLLLVAMGCLCAVC